MYNHLTEYSSNYSETPGSQWLYAKDEGNDFNANIVNTNDCKSVRYKFVRVAQPSPNAANGVLKTATPAVPLKYLSTVISGDHSKYQWLFAKYI